MIKTVWKLYVISIELEENYKSIEELLEQCTPVKSHYAVNHNGANQGLRSRSGSECQSNCCNHIYIFPVEFFEDENAN